MSRSFRFHRRREVALLAAHAGRGHAGLLVTAAARTCAGRAFVAAASQASRAGGVCSVLAFRAAARPLVNARLRTALALVAYVLSMGHAAAQMTPPTLGFEEALRLAAERSQALVASDAEVRAARERVAAAGQLPDPTLKIGVNNFPVGGPDRFTLTRDFMTMQSVGVMQELTRTDKRQARVRKAEVDIETGLISRQVQLAELQRETALAWLERSYLEVVRELLTRQVAETELLAQAAEVTYRAGRGGQAEIFAARANVESLRDKILDAERRIATATTQLARWVGPPAKRPLAARPALDELPFGVAEIRSRLDHHPMLRMAANQEAMATAEVEIAAAARKPDWSVELMYSKRGDAYGDMVSVNVSVPLQIDRQGRQDRELAARVALRDQARALREERFRSLQAEALAWAQEWRSLRERASNYDRTLLPLARQRTESSLTSYRAGSGNLSMVLDGRRMELEVRMEQLRLEIDAARAWAQLNYLIPVEVSAGTSPYRASPN